MVDGYAQKLLNSGYEEHQVRRILVMGIKGFENKRLRHAKLGWRLRRTAEESGDMRARRKLLAKTNWYKKRRKENLYDNNGGSKRKAGKEQQRHMENKTVLFVEQTVNGELGKRLREMMTRISPILGFGVKIVERNGAPLKNKFPQASLWEGAHCGRNNCITCNQGAEFITPCSRRSLVYENTCAQCNKGAGAKEEIRSESMDEKVPSLYIGETSRTIQERGVEHWGAYRGNDKVKEGSHIYKHQELQHEGGEPHFIPRAISFHRSALSRQTAEAVRIRRRGGMGALLNSKSEFNRCYIPRLTVVQEDIALEMEKEEEQTAAKVGEELRSRDNVWERRKIAARPSQRVERGSTKRHHTTIVTREQRPSKRRKYALLTNWGEPLVDKRMSVEEETTTGGSLVQPSQDRGGEERDDDEGGGGELTVTPPSMEPGTLNDNPDRPTDDICASVDNVRGNNLNCVDNNCVIEDNKCVTHGCIVKTMKVTSKKWGWKNRSKCYGWITNKKQKVICPLKNKGLVDHDISPVYTHVQRGLGGISDSGDLGLVETQMGANLEEKVSG